MKDTTHTPGPWHEGAGNGVGYVFGDQGRMRIEDSNATTYSICRVTDDYHEPEDAANARLIAAAPELLAALAVLVDHAQEPYPHFESPRGEKDIIAALDAISKATKQATATSGEDATPCPKQ